jgi:hypothetical protein
MNEWRRVGTVASFPRGKALVGGVSLWNFLCARESGENILKLINSLILFYQFEQSLESLRSLWLESPRIE